MGCSFCGNYREQAKYEVKEGKPLKAIMTSLNGVAVMTGIKKPDKKYLDKNFKPE